MYSRYIKILLSTSILGDKEQNSFTGNDKTKQNSCEENGENIKLIS